MSMTLIDYLKSLPDDAARKAFAKRCRTSLGYLIQIGYGNKPRFSVELALRIEEKSDGKVRCETLRYSDVWRYVRGTAKRRAHSSAPS